LKLKNVYKALAVKKPKKKEDKMEEKNAKRRNTSIFFPFMLPIPTGICSPPGLDKKLKHFASLSSYLVL